MDCDLKQMENILSSVCTKYLLPSLERPLTGEGEDVTSNRNSQVHRH